MKRRMLLLSFMLCCAGVFAQHQGIGVRLGDPMGLSYKMYFRDHKAIEFGLGSAAPGWHQNYYKKSFEKRDQYEDSRYRSHSVQSTIYLQGRYLLHNDIQMKGMEGDLDWYWGVGGMLKFSKVKYRFQNIENAIVESDTRNDVDFGPEGIGGMEYEFQDVPVTIFGEVSLLLELVDRPTLRPFAGIGARYNF